MNTIDRLDRHIRTSPGCWEWTASKDHRGYGRTRIDKVAVSAHRAVYELMVGPVPAGLVMDHLCRNRGCCNPEHLEPVTQQENVLRGNGLAAKNAKKTHCPKGHPYSGTNLHVDCNGKRYCKTCVW